MSLIITRELNFERISSSTLVLILNYPKAFMVAPYRNSMSLDSGIGVFLSFYVKIKLFNSVKNIYSKPMYSGVKSSSWIMIDWKFWMSVPSLLMTPTHMKSNFICFINYNFISSSGLTTSINRLLPTMMEAFLDIFIFLVGEFSGEMGFSML